MPKTPKKVFCTLGPSSLNPRIIERLDLLHVDLFRLNLSHTPVVEIEPLVELIRTHSSVPVCLDTQGAQARTGTFTGGSATLAAGAMVTILPFPAMGDAATVPIYPPGVLPQLLANDLISIGTDGTLLQVIDPGPPCVAYTINKGTVGENKAISIVGKTIELPPLTDSDLAAVNLAIKLNIPQIALSFTNRRSDVELLRNLMGPETQIIAKVESRAGVENLTGILEVADAVLIDRGDLSREVAVERLPYVQKEIISRAKSAGVPVYVATNLLESMVTSPAPTRAEVNDVINTLIDGADGLVLAAETAIGQYPVECATMIQRLIRQYESSISWPEQSNSLSASGLIAPHGGPLVENILEEHDSTALRTLPRLELDQYGMTDARQLAIGTYSPLDGFMNREQLESVLTKSRLPGGEVWTMPILLQLPAGITPSYLRGETVAITHLGEIQGLLEIDECFTYQLDNLALSWFGTCDSEHPGVARLLKGSDRFLAGKVSLLSQSSACRWPYELTPRQTRFIFDHNNWERVLGFHTRNVCHRAHEYLQFTALAEQSCDGVLIHPVVGPKKSGDFSSEIILKTYRLLIRDHFPPNTSVLGGFGTYSRYAGPREAVFTALCRQNFGCSHFLVGRDHTGVGNVYSPIASQRVFEDLGDIGITPVFFDEVYYCERCGEHVEKCTHGTEFKRRISGTATRKALLQGEQLPEWHMRESVSRLILDELEWGATVFNP
jgi:pyruvate kinase